MKIFYVLLNLSACLCIWPPPYKIHLNHSEEFVIFENIDDDLYSDDDEMIKPKDLQNLDLNNDKEKYYKIHKYAMEMGRKQAKNFSGNPTNYITRIKWKERNFVSEDDVPYVAGFFDSKDVLKENENVFYYNEMAKSVIESDVKEKRGSVAKNDTDYDYKQFKMEYDGDIKKLKVASDTLQFVNVKEEESAKDAMGKIVNFNRHFNCTDKEAKGIGLTAIKCFVNDVKHPKTADKELLTQRIIKIVLAWFGVYLLIAIPLWCEKGWCCCCFRCKYCRPLERIDEVKKFIADNPPGTFKNEDGAVVNYKPTHYEIYSQKRLEQAIMKL